MGDIVDDSQDKLKVALRQWRESLVNMSGRNRLLNYRPTRSSTLEFSGQTSQQVFDLISADDGAFTVGTKPPVKALPTSDLTDGAHLGEQVLDTIEDFDYNEFPNRLFADKTQREVDRALKNLATAAKREFLDKGLSILYVAFGSLVWIDDSGDSRRSPLLFVPVELRSDGPKQPHRLYPSSEDRAGNPALELKLREFGLELPSPAMIDETIETSGLATALDLYRALELPEGWRIEELASLSNFMFAKEAMFRDLEANEERILENPVLKAIASSQSDLVEQFAFDMLADEQIDALAPPESAHLVLDADSSQRSAISAARDGRSFVLDGPPGTGKSQTIANIIAALIHDGKRVLFVSEKVVALDVVRNRLQDRGLGSFILPLHSHRAVRSEVAALMSAALTLKPVPAGRAKPMTRIRSTELRESLNQYADAMNEIRLPFETTVHEVVGALQATGPTGESPAPTFLANQLDPRQFEEIKKEAARAAEFWDILRAGQDNLWWGIDETDSLRYDVEAARLSLDRLVRELDHHFPRRAVFGLGNNSQWSQALALTRLWHRHHDQIGTDWLAKPNLPEIAISVEDYANSVNATQRASNAAEALCSPRWRDIRVVSNSSIDIGDNVRDLMPLNEKTLRSELLQCEKSLAAGAEAMSAVISATDSLATLVGLRTPTFVVGLDSFLTAVDALLSTNAPIISWLVTREVLADVTSEAHALRSAKIQESAARLASSKYFTGNIEALDVKTISARVRLNSGLTRRFSREARSDRHTLAGVALEPTKQSIRELPLATAWQDAREAVSSREEALGSNLGRYDTTDAGWAATEAALVAGATILESSEISDAESLARSLRDESTRAMSSTQTADLKEKLAQWRGWTQNHNSLLNVEVAQGSMAAVRALLLDAAIEANRVENDLSEVLAVLGDDPRLGQALEAVGVLTTASTTETNFQTALVGFREILGPLNETADPRAVATLRDNLRWAKDVRKAVATDDTQATSPDQISALMATAVSDELHTAGLDWDRRLAALKAHFESDRAQGLPAELDDPTQGPILLQDLFHDVEGPDQWIAADLAHSRLVEFGMDGVMQSLMETGVPAAEIGDRITRAVLSHWLNFHLKNDPRLGAKVAENRDDMVTEYRRIDRELIADATNEIVISASARRPTTAYGQSALIRREGEKKRRHIPVRDLVDQARDVIQAIHPCFMMSPLAVSQYLPSDIEFDVVIFDEASQVTPGDAINCIYRGKALIAAGDRRQLPPTSFFAAGTVVDEDAEEEDLANDFESILDLMKSSGGFNTLTLRWHYRSRHENLIAYSNHSFYDGGLVTFPGAIDEDENLGVKFHLVNGVYRRSTGQDNPKEALAVAARVLHHFDSRPKASLGVVAFSAAQRDSIENAITVARANRPDLDKYFKDDRLDGLFVKSLEEVQGDERDVIILSIGYGPDESGKVYRNFGPINRKGGERRLNVAISRARQLVEVVSSMTASQIGETASEGSRHLRRYLDFAERGTKALTLELGPAGLGTDSPFEDSVISAIRSWGYDVQPQVGVAGFRIDIGVKHPNAPGVFMLGIECDGAMYHSSRTARDRDRLRHEVLEGLGWQLHHIWGTGWYRHRERELTRLKELLEERSSAPVSGRVTPREVPSKPASVAARFEPSFHLKSENPAWVVPYVPAKYGTFPRGLDLTQSQSPYEIVSFVQSVVAAESPLHIDVLCTRLREHSGIGRVGHRIRAYLEQAVQVAGAQRDGEFLLSKGAVISAIRQASSYQSRPAEHVHVSEMEFAVRNIVNDARGATKEEVVEGVSRAFGWNRTSTAIAAIITKTIDRLIALGDLKETSAGISIA